MSKDEKYDVSQHEGHTPGPWLLDNDEVKPLGVILNEDTPDARLIAATPEILDALKEAYDEIDKLRRVLSDVTADLTVTRIDGPDGQGAAVIAALDTLSEVMYVD